MARVRNKEASINVDGLPELLAALKAIDKETAKRLRLTNKSVADFVAADARAAAYSLGGVAGHVAPSIKAAAGAQFAGVSGGGPAYPMFGGAEFGAGSQYPQFKPWRGNSADAGYFVYPAIRQDMDRIETAYKEAIDDLIQEVGLA